MTDLVDATAALVAATGEIIGTKSEVLAWSVGSVDGGPGGNGNYPFTAADGTIVMVPCPAKIAAMNGDPVAAAATLQAKVDAAEDAKDTAVAVADDLSTALQALDISLPSADYPYQIIDAKGRICFAVKNDGSVLAAALWGLLLNGHPAADIDHAVSAADTVDETASEEFAWSVKDGHGRAALGILPDGTVAAGSVDAGELNGHDAAAIDLAVEAAAISDLTLSERYAWAVKDAAGRAAVGILHDGRVEIGAGLFGDKAIGRFARYPGVFSHDYAYVASMGQSNAGGNTATDLTTAQEYDNVGFASFATAPTRFLPLTLANTRNSGGTYKEAPLYGGLGHLKELIAEECGLNWQDNGYVLVGATNAIGNTAIADLDKGTTPYNASIAQVTATRTLAEAQGRRAFSPAFFWTHGESDAGLSAGAYKAALAQLIADYNGDVKAATGQSQPVHCISWQVSSGARNVALETMELAEESPLLHVACPAYIFTYGDPVHIDATSAKWLGGYYGLVFKRVIIDAKSWQPLKPIAHAVNGAVIDLMFNREGLAFDTTIVPAQTNYGFTLANAGSVTISTIEIIKPNRVRLTLSAAPPAGTEIRYADNVSTGKSPYTGGAGNLRDSQGDSIVYSAIAQRMDNWCVIFRYKL